MRRLLLALTLLAPAPAAAQQPALRGTWTGGAVPKQVRGTSRALAGSTAVTVASSGDVVRLRVSVTMPCNGGRGGANLSSGDDLLMRLPLAADGTFGGTVRRPSRELGSARLEVRGALVADGGTVSVEVNALQGTDIRCRTGQRTFPLKRFVVPPQLAVSSGLPPGGAVLLGRTTTTSTVPFAAIARVSADGKRIDHLFATDVLRCSASGPRARRSRFRVDVQRRFSDLALRGGRHSSTRGSRESAAQRRRGIRSTFTASLVLRATEAGLVASYRERSTYREPGYAERCRGFARYRLSI